MNGCRSPLESGPFVLGVGLVLSVLSAASTAQDAAFPKANIDMTVLFPAGTSADVTARILAQGMARRSST